MHPTSLAMASAFLVIPVFTVKSLSHRSVNPNLAPWRRTSHRYRTHRRTCNFITHTQPHRRQIKEKQWHKSVAITNSKTLLQLMPLGNNCGSWKREANSPNLDP
jgi:hypothetical protein